MPAWFYFNSLAIASAGLPATTQLADPATTASSSNQRNPKSSMHSGKSVLMVRELGQEKKDELLKWMIAGAGRAYRHFASARSESAGGHV
jgi:hypothetical protein